MSYSSYLTAEIANTMGMPVAGKNTEVAEEMGFHRKSAQGVSMAFVFFA